MKVNYKPGTLYTNPSEFGFQEGDHVTIVVTFWVKRDEEEEDVYYHGTITEFDEEREGFWARLEDVPEKEEFFHFGDLEAVIPGNRIPFLLGTTVRPKN